MSKKNKSKKQKKLILSLVTLAGQRPVEPKKG